MSVVLDAAMVLCANENVRTLFFKLNHFEISIPNLIGFFGTH